MSRWPGRSRPRSTRSSARHRPTVEEILGLLDAAKGLFDAIQGLAAAPAAGRRRCRRLCAEIGERLFELLLTDYSPASTPAPINLLSNAAT